MSFQPAALQPRCPGGDLSVKLIIMGSHTTCTHADGPQDLRFRNLLVTSLLHARALLPALLTTAPCDSHPP